MVRYSLLVWLVTGSVAFAADANQDGCQDEYAANGACVDVDATVDASSTVGANASVFDGASVGPQVALAADVVVGSRAFLAGRVAHTSTPIPVGANTVIGRGAQLGPDHVLGTDVTVGRAVVAGARLTIADGGSLGYAVQVGDNVTIGAGAVVGNLVALGDFTTLGDNAVVARSVTVADAPGSGSSASVNGVVGPQVTVASGARIEQGARVRKQADIGAGAAVESSGRIGREATIQAGATVFGRVGANATVGAGATVEAGAIVSRGGEVCAGATVPSGSQVASDGTWPAEGCSVVSTCQTVKAATPSSTDGIYSIDPDGLGGTAAFDAYCDMTTLGGGWTLIANLGTIPTTKTHLVGSTDFLPLFNDFGTYDANGMTNGAAFSRMDLLTPALTNDGEFMALRASNTNKRFVWPIADLTSWAADILPPISYIRLTQDGTTWFTRTHNIVVFNSGARYTGYAWNSNSGSSGINCDNCGNSFNTGLSHRSLLYMESYDNSSYDQQWFHASPMTLTDSTSPVNNVQDIAIFVRETP
ncbi:MAG: UDP-3-O-[3-hydroxymyristoyl] glucosamine N-acyltransferase [Myxococcota bacterium]|jgi:UDP-3-O-[3-hydroxymyristoyl] glucosamine N-acyltransferase